MVGEKPGMMDFLKKWLRRPFMLGRWDCLQMIREFYSLPDRWEGIDLSPDGDYTQLWQGDKREARALYLQMLSDYFTPVSPAERLPGDLIVIESPLFSIGIYLGNDVYLGYSEKKGSYTARLTGRYTVMRRKNE